MCPLRVVLLSYSFLGILDMKSIDSKASCFGGSFLQCRSQGLGCLMWLAPQRYAPYLWDHSHWWITAPGMGFWWVHVSTYLLNVSFLSFLSQCVLFVLCCKGDFQLVSTSFVERSVLYVAIDLVCPWEKGSFGSSYATILNHQCPLLSKTCRQESHSTKVC